MRLMPWVEELDENSVNHFEPEDRSESQRGCPTATASNDSTTHHVCLGVAGLDGRSEHLHERRPA